MSEDRVDAPCPHFGPCGGCALQHFADHAYGAWKRDLLVRALARAGFQDADVAPMAACAPRARRRAVFAGLRSERATFVGFHERGSNRIIDIGECQILTPRLEALIAPLRALIAQSAPAGASVSIAVHETEGGVDLLLAARDWPDGPGDREALAAFASVQGLARLTLDSGAGPEPIAIRGSTAVRFDDVPSAIPPGGFLQATVAGEAALRAVVMEAAAEAGRGRLLDLFAGSGGFGLPAARSRTVLAVEGDADACAAMDAAARAASLPLTVEKRDLFQRPLAGAELREAAMAIFDPPRAGAKAQAEALAADGPPVVVAISCNPATLARDAAILRGGGYRLARAVPVDQFLWSGHLEAACVFQRATRGSMRLLGETGGAGS